MKKRWGGIGRARRGGLPQKAWKVRKTLPCAVSLHGAEGAHNTPEKPSPKTVASLPKPFRNGFLRTSFCATPTDRPREERCSFSALGAASKARPRLPRCSCAALRQEKLHGASPRASSSPVASSVHPESQTHTQSKVPLASPPSPSPATQRARSSIRPKPAAALAARFAPYKVPPEPYRPYRPYRPYCAQCRRRPLPLAPGRRRTRAPLPSRAGKTLAVR